MDDSTDTFLDAIIARCNFSPPNTSVTCAISGGPDSMALLLLAHAYGLSVTAVHVDHGLRSDSATDIDVILPVTTALEIPVEIHKVDIEPGSNLEARARRARYAVFPAGVLTGHTADDQAETVLINLLRGAGAQGLAAMRPGFQRPLLGLRRIDTVAVCAHFGVSTVVDSTNSDPAFLRNRVRHELLELIADISSRDPIPLLTRSATVLRDDNDLLNELASAIDPTDAPALARAPLPLARRAIRQWLADPYPPDLATIERILAVARGEVLACEIGQNRQIRRSKQRLFVHLVG